MFQAVTNIISGMPPVAPPKDVEPFTMANAEAAYAGRVYKFSGGVLTLASGTDKNAAVILVESADAATPGAKVRGFWITPGTVFKTKITNKNGTALTTLHSSFKVGATVNINDTGDGVDGESNSAAVNGPLTVLRMDAAKEEVWVVFNTCAVALDCDTTGG